MSPLGGKIGSKGFLVETFLPSGGTSTEIREGWRNASREELIIDTDLNIDIYFNFG